jgi:hypothetical protein
MTTTNVFAQYSITGQVSGNDIYTNLEPDSIVQAQVVHLSTMGGSFSVDVDKNGSMDFSFSASGGGGLGGGSGSSYVSALRSDIKIITHSETSEGYPGGVFYTVNVPDTLDENQVIDNNSVFTDDSGIFWSTTYGQASGPYVNTWDGIGDHFIGFFITEGVDSLYGWLRVNVTNVGSHITTLKDFACNINPNSINQPDSKNSVCIYPNPVSDELFIKTPEYVIDNYIVIFSITGQIICEEKFNDSEFSISTENMIPGIYFIRIENNYSTSYKQIIKE